jgi:hypothetical protein
MVFCKITTNFAGLRFATSRMGLVEIPAHEFYMSMESVSISSMTVEDSASGPVASFGGILRTETRLFSGDRQRTFIEDSVPFGCEAVGGGQGANIEISATNFSMTAQFNPLKEHAAIFGEKPTFAGRLTQGNIVVVA